MHSAASLSNAVNRLWLPRLPLTACMRAVMSRNSVGVLLDDDQRYNYFPASPLCSLSWWFAGESFFVPLPARDVATQERTPMRAAIVLGGPHNRPSVSWNPGPVHGMMLMLMPDALQALTGIQTDGLVNRAVAAQDVLPPAWMQMCHAVQQAPDDDARVRLIEEFLDPLWQAARPGSPSIASARYEDWAQGLALRAATSGLGRSVRQMERRIKLWAGQPLRELRGMSRAERAFFQSMAVDDQRRSLADVATDAGYADQSHMSRETRRITGFAPEDLRRRIESDECFWAYRLWRSPQRWHGAMPMKAGARTQAKK